jgi:4-hydroxybenzoate polyprenyltransferase
MNNPYLRLIRLDKPIGIWLLLLPCWWGVVLASPHIPNLWVMLLFALGAIVMRGAGCVVNDIYDRHLDRQVARTQNRPLARGEISLWQAVLFLIVLLLVGLGVLLFFNPTTILVGALSLILVFTYPLMKRITWWPQLFLGVTFNWGVLMGSCAIITTISLSVILLYLAGVFWTLGYDTIYAHQDIQDDMAVGIKSTAVYFGEKSRQWVVLFYIISLMCFALAGWVDGLSRFYFYLLVVAACYALVQMFLWKPSNPENCLKRFKSNRGFGLIILVALCAGKLL